jgi:hypothetical protein
MIFWESGFLLLLCLYHIPYMCVCGNKEWNIVVVKVVYIRITRLYISGYQGFYFISLAKLDSAHVINGFYSNGSSLFFRYCTSFVQLFFRTIYVCGAARKVIFVWRCWMLSELCSAEYWRSLNIQKTNYWTFFSFLLLVCCLLLWNKDCMCD